MVSGGWVVIGALVLTLAACGSDGSDAASSTTTTRPVHLATGIVLAGTDEIEAGYAQGIAPDGRGWILSGTSVLGHATDIGTIVNKVMPAIPPEWAAQGYNHVGDIDVVGHTLYVPFEQSDYERGEQAMARYDAVTLQFIDATPVHQHHNSFVAVDGKRNVAYSTDWFDDDALAPVRPRRRLEAAAPAEAERDARAHPGWHGRRRPVLRLDRRRPQRRVRRRPPHRRGAIPRLDGTRRR